jgi:hypothetical protein
VPPIPGICSITFRSEALARFGGIPEQFESQYEDQAMIAKLLLHYPCMVIDECLARYRQHAESLTHRAQVDRDSRIASESCLCPGCSTMPWTAASMGRCCDTHPGRR